MSICKRNPSNSEDVACNFAFITFDSATSVESALKQDAISGTYLRKQNAAVKLDVHRRKAPRREKRFELQHYEIIAQNSTFSLQKN